jgi:hypothetical protein
MKWIRTPLGAALTAVTLLVVLGASSVFIVRGVVADGPPWLDHRWGDRGWDLPPELEGLADLSAEERFAHFRGARIELTDADGNPMTVQATPGTVTAVDAISLTLAANDGSTKTFAVDGTTTVHGGRDQDATRGIAVDDTVVVLTLNDSATARTVLAGVDERFGRHGGHRRPFGWGR